MWQARAQVRKAVRAFLSLRERPLDLGAPFLFALYVPVFLVAYASTDVDMGEIAGRSAHDGRYCAPLYPFLCLLAACALDRAIDIVPRAKAVASLVTCSLCALFVTGTLSLCSSAAAGESLRTSGSSEEHFAEWMAWTWRTDVHRLDRIVKGV